MKAEDHEGLGRRQGQPLLARNPSMSAMITALSTAPAAASSFKPLTVEQAFKATDTGNKGYLEQSDLKSAIVKLSPEGMKVSEADATAIAKSAFAAMDQDKDGKVTQAEFKQSAQSQDRPEGPPPGGRSPRAGGAGPQGGGGGGGAGGTAGASGGGSASAKTYDAADSNQDGTVSEAERLAYADKKANQTASSADRRLSGAIGA
jgi:hypothetical protein